MPGTEGFQRTALKGAVPLAAKIDFLRRPESYPGRVKRVRAVETHISWVFLTEKHAYKLKKPLRYPILNFASLESRRRNSLAELCLNRRLAPGVYLAVVPLKLDPEGRLGLGGRGRTVDWLVKMRRLPKERTLEDRIRRRNLRREDLACLARMLAGFYRDANPVAMGVPSYRRRYAANIRANRRELTRRKWRLPADIVRRVTTAQIAFLEGHADLFDERVRAKRIVEGHGDLRPEHIYLGARPMVLDSLEFNRAFRVVDPADEVSFLALECERLGARRLGECIVERYEKLTGDRIPEKLLAFYKSERACVRAKIAILHLRESGARRAAKWRRRAIRYLKFAEKYARAL